jgi:hypothetical protein
MLKAGTFALALLVGSSGVSWAQTAAQSAEAEQVKARQKIFMMEGVLERAVQVGIDSFRRRLSAVMPDDMLLVAGDGPAARGFRLDGYGVFFDVEVPSVRPSLAWSLQTMNETAAMFRRDMAALQAQIQRGVPDVQQRAEMERALARIQQQVAPAPPQAAAQQPAAPPPADARATVAAQTIERPAAAAPAPPPLLNADPSELFTQAVANALIDAMLENSGSLILTADEWLTVAARDNAQGSRFVASDPSDVMTVVLRVKGSDLAEYQARRLTADEVRKRVEVRAF